MLHRLASLGRPPRTVVWMLLAALAALVVSVAVLGVVLDVAAVALALYALVRWSNAREDAPREDEAQRHYGDSIVDARTSVDPAVGMRPVNSEPRRR
jgi:membrane protein implicated in regulation of membrane protease activity